MLLLLLNFADSATFLLLLLPHIADSAAFLLLLMPHLADSAAFFAALLLRMLLFQIAFHLISLHFHWILQYFVKFDTFPSFWCRALLPGIFHPVGVRAVPPALRASINQEDQ